MKGQKQLAFNGERFWSGCFLCFFFRSTVGGLMPADVAVVVHYFMVLFEVIELVSAARHLPVGELTCVFSCLYGSMCLVWCQILAKR